MTTPTERRHGNTGFGGGMTPSQNTAAWSQASPKDAGTARGSDSKRSDAAQLAQELGSSSPWSEALLPHALGTGSPQEQSAHHSNTMVSSRRNTPMTNTPSSALQQDFDPPPAYSNVAEVHELPADSPHTTPRPRIMDIPDGGARDDPHEATRDVTEVVGHGPEAPLLDHNDRRPRRGWTPWIEQGKTPARRRARLLCLVIFFAVFASIVLCIIFDGWEGDDSRSAYPVRPSQTLVSTGPVFERHETVENVNGAYKLYDSLEITTTTGTIDIEVDPQPGWQPASLILASDVGSITVRVSSNYLRRSNRAARAIHTEIRSFTGTIDADILLGNGGSAFADTTTGVQYLTVMTYEVGYHDKLSNLTTYSQTGSQRVVVAPLDSADKAITNLHAEHHGFATGSLDIIYPSTWLGEVYALSSSLGRIEVEGEGLKYTKSSHREILARRGSSRFRQRIEVISDGTGSASFKC